MDHLGLILDGNRRWARAQGLPQLEGHRKGYENLYRIAKLASARGVKYISAYVFSTENWDRAQEEVDYLMDFFVRVVTKEIYKFHDENFRVVFLGSSERLSGKVRDAMALAEERTRENTGTVLAVCLNYGGQTEIAEGVARLIADGVPAAEVTVKKLGEYMYHPEIPPIDLLIRTSGEQRLSGFMLWRMDYAELYFSPVPWPAFSEAHFDEAMEEYDRRQRRFGK